MQKFENEKSHKGATTWRRHWTGTLERIGLVLFRCWRSKIKASDTCFL